MKKKKNQKPDNSKASKIRFLLASGLCVALFLATTPSDNSCTYDKDYGTVLVRNMKTYDVNLWIGDNGPYAVGKDGKYTRITKVDPGNHVYVWLSVGYKINGKRIFGGGTVRVEKTKESSIVIPLD